MKELFLLMLTVFSLTSGFAQSEVAGVKLPNTENFGNTTLQLNGAGVREKFWMDMYAGGLYLQEKSSDAAKIVEADKPMAIKLHIVSKMITSKRMIDAVNEGFENSTGGNTATLQNEIHKFIGFFEEQINKNDIFDIVYLPAEGVKVFKNGKEQGSIQGMSFKKALFGIWLGDEPADDDLKEGMLGT